MHRALKVLLIDDHAGFRAVAARLLTTLGHSAVHTGDPEEAQRLFDQGGIDVVIMDLLLETTDGVTLARQLEERAGHPLRVLFISGCDVGLLGDQPWLEQPHHRFLPKPYTAQALQNELDALIAESPPPG